MEDFYDRVLQIKKMHRLNNQQLGDVIGLSGDAFSGYQLTKTKYN